LINDAVKTMLKAFAPLKTAQDRANALQEILQLITLLGLHRGRFFEKAAFYGGTALRILYSLERFSEDLDFCLTSPNRSFTLKPYFPAIKDELARFGFSAKITEKKTGQNNAIESAFVKQSTYHGLIAIGHETSGIHKDQLIKIRLEVDKSNPSGGIECKKLVSMPIPFMVKTLTESSLFAGKLHAVIARSYMNRVKGRDYYDLAFFTARKTPVNLRYLEAKLQDSGHLDKQKKINIDCVKSLLHEKFASVDFAKARQDVIPFLKPDKILAVEEWSAELFGALIENLQCED
jgi:predicted nucleotidyltransferase component of viral defense system